MNALTIVYYQDNRSLIENKPKHITPYSKPLDFDFQTNLSLICFLNEPL